MMRRLLHVGWWVIAVLVLVGAVSLWGTSHRHIRGVDVSDRTRALGLCVGRGQLYLVHVWSEGVRHTPTTKPTSRDYYVFFRVWTEPPHEKRKSDEFDFPLFAQGLDPRWEFAGLSLRSGRNGRGDVTRALVLPMWLVTLALLPAPVIMTTRLLRTRRRRKRGLCLRCGYDLRGSKDSARCPECGAPAPAAGPARPTLNVALPPPPAP